MPIRNLLPAIFFFLAYLTVAAAALGAKAAEYPFQDPTLPVEKRVEDLLSRLTLAEKASLLGNEERAIERLGVPHFNHGEALHGLMGPGPATVFPQPIGLAATFDPEGIREMAAAISDEARAKHHHPQGKTELCQGGPLSFFAPVVNMVRDPRWGRTQETYGEDPFLTSRLGVAYVKGLQGDHPKYLKAIACPKHFAFNNEEHNRFWGSANTTEKNLREYELPGFRACIVEGQAQCIMTAYNAVNGVPCCANKYLLQDILRREWGFKGYAITDAYAVNCLIEKHKYVATWHGAAAVVLNAGIDVEFGDVTQTNIQRAVKQGMVTIETVNRAVHNALLARFRLGLFDPDELVPDAKIPNSVVGCKQHQALALKLAEESLVLLKNDLLKNDKGDGQRLLPLNAKQIKSIAVVGPVANLCQFGNYSGQPVIRPVSPLEGLRRRTGRGIKVNYVPWENTIVPVSATNLRTSGRAEASQGLQGEYFAHADCQGQPALAKVDTQINFDWQGKSPAPAVPPQDFSVRWTGRLIAPRSGRYVLGLTNDNGARLYLDGQLLVDNGGNHTTVIQTAQVDLKAGQSCALRIEFFKKALWPGSLTLQWSVPNDPGAPPTAAITAAEASDVVVACLGLGGQLEAEDRDRATLDLPDDQQIFIEEIVKANPRTIVVLENGSPCSIQWIAQNVPAIVEAWYPGEQGGTAIAEALFGDVNPAGRLPVTFYAGVEQLPPMNDYEVSKGRTYLYLRQKPLYPFGHGLSYTAFSYNKLRITPARSSATGTFSVGIDVTNTGDCDGDEVVQVYLRRAHSSVTQPIKQLKGFQRVPIGQGQTKTVSIPIRGEDLSRFDAAQKKWVVAPGEYEVMVGASSQDIRAKGILVVE